MGIRVQHQGAGAGAGIDDGFKRKYEHRIRQQEKIQDRMFQVGMQNRNVALQRENMIIGDNLQANQRRIARQDAQADLKEDREFAANLRGEQRANELADRDAQQKFQMDLLAQQQQRQDEVHNRQRAEGFEEADVLQQQQWVQKGIDSGQFTDEASQMLRMNISDEFAILKNKKLDSTQRAEALARVRDDRRIISIHGRRPMEAPQEVKQPTALQADPKLFELYMGVVNGSIPEGETMSAAERMAKAQQLYEGGQDPMKLEAMVHVEKFKSQRPFGEMIPKSGNAPEMQRLQEYASSQPPEIQKAMGVMIDPNSSPELRYYANSLLEKQGITPAKIGEISTGVSQAQTTQVEEGKDYTPRTDAPIKDFSKQLGQLEGVPKAKMQARLDIRDRLVREYRLAVKHGQKADPHKMYLARWMDVLMDEESSDEALVQAVSALEQAGIDPENVLPTATEQFAGMLKEGFTNPSGLASRLAMNAANVVQGTRRFDGYGSKDPTSPLRVEYPKK